MLLTHAYLARRCPLYRSVWRRVLLYMTIFTICLYHCHVQRNLTHVYSNLSHNSYLLTMYELKAKNATIIHSNLVHILIYVCYNTCIVYAIITQILDIVSNFAHLAIVIKFNFHIKCFRLTAMFEIGSFFNLPVPSGYKFIHVKCIKRHRKKSKLKKLAWWQTNGI